MATYWDEIEIEDFEFDEEKEIFTHPCPCGDKFVITLVYLFSLLILLFLGSID